MHRYGGPPPEDVPTLADLMRLRAAVFLPSAATLVVVGDITEEAARREAREKFAHWSSVNARSGPDTRPSAPASPPALPQAPRIALIRNRTIAQVWGIVGARGPGRDSPDAAAFLVLASMLGGNLDSTLYHHLREDLGVAYTLGAQVNWVLGSCMMSLTGSFDTNDAVAGVRGLLDAIDAVRATDPPPDAVERAKAATIAGIRHQMATDEGIASELAGAVALGLDVQIESTGRFRTLIAAVSAADVGAVARRYLHSDALRVVLMGRPESLRGAPSLGLGDPAWIDPLGRPLPNPAL